MALIGGKYEWFSKRLLDEAIDPKRWIKVLKQAYRENKKEIIEATTKKHEKKRIEEKQSEK